MKKLLALAAALLFSAGLAQVKLDYWLWDANQQPAYEQCAAVFSEQNPNIKINITQQGWGDYWTGITTGFVSGTAPDVFTNHLAKYPEFAANGQLVDIQPLIERDGVATDIYIGELATLWTRDNARYGLPKDWDTIAIFYNKEMLDTAGVSVEELNNLTWNPQDGGTFEEVVAKLTLDANGNNGLSPDFDKDNVVQFGYLTVDGADAYGQTQWSHFAVSNGWQFNDGLYAEEYYYDDPKFVETIDWYAGLIDKGYTPKFSDVNGLGDNSLFAAGQGALTTDGSWMIGWYLDNSPFEVGFARLAAGPEGRKSMFNGLADSIWVGSKNQEEAWEWVKFLASAECQNIVGSYGVVFPAIQSGVDAALAAYAERGADVSAFTEQALEPGGTFLFPIADFASEVSDIMTSAMESILLRESDTAETLAKANEEVNALFR